MRTEAIVRNQSTYHRASRIVVYDISDAMPPSICGYPVSSNDSVVSPCGETATNRWRASNSDLFHNVCTAHVSCILEDAQIFFGQCRDADVSADRPETAGDSSRAFS